MENEKKMCHLKTTTMSLAMGALVMTKKGTDEYIYKLTGSPSLYEAYRVSSLFSIHNGLFQ